MKRKQYQVRLSDDEAAAFERAATAKGKSVATWLRDLGREESKMNGVKCECPDGCGWVGSVEDTVIVETMPEHLRSSHEAAGYRGLDTCGAYPINGAVRLRVEASCADAMVESDPEWSRIITE